MSRLVAFGLGGLFGAVALHLLAPDGLWRAEPAPSPDASVLEAGTQAPPLTPRSAAPGVVTAPGSGVPVTDTATGAALTPTEIAHAADIPPSEATSETSDTPSAAAASAVPGIAQPSTGQPATASVPPTEGTPVAGPPMASTAVPAPIDTEPTTPSAAPVASAPAAPPVAAPPPTTEAQVSTPESSAEATIAPQPPAPKSAEAANAMPESVVEVPPGIPKTLMIPVEGVAANRLIDTFTEARGGGARPHDAIDIMAPTGTPVRAVDDGKIVKLFLSDAGGITVYQFDPTESFAYYYAHLDRYADGLAEGQAVKRGDVLGYVGYTGNANPAAPHLHFAIVALGPEKRWWQGTPINPYPILIGATKDDATVASKQP